MSDKPPRYLNKSDGRYDTVTQMYEIAPHDPDPEVLRYWRWLAEQGKTEHPQPFGPPSGEYAHLA